MILEKMEELFAGWGASLAACFWQRVRVGLRLYRKGVVRLRLRACGCDSGGVPDNTADTWKMTVKY